VTNALNFEAGRSGVSIQIGAKISDVSSMISGLDGAVKIRLHQSIKNIYRNFGLLCRCSISSCDCATFGNSKPGFKKFSHNVTFFRRISARDGFSIALASATAGRPSFRW
jgi:hypothetical protein